MKKTIAAIVILISCIMSIFAQKATDVVGNRKYEFVATVRAAYLYNGKPDGDKTNLDLYEMYHLSYYTDNMGIRHDTWDFRGYYLKNGKDGSYYKVILNSPESKSASYPHVCHLLNWTVGFKYDF